MDAFAVSICKGLSIRKFEWKKAFIIALYFGIFQALMPTIFQTLVVDIDHWLAFILLGITGGNMIYESFNDESEKRSDSLDFKTMILLAIATSIDALAVGITFAFFEINIFSTICIIGIVTFILSTLGVRIGNKFGDKFQNKAEIIGGLIIILIGLKILLSHLGII